MKADDNGVPGGLVAYCGIGVGNGAIGTSGTCCGVGADVDGCFGQMKEVKKFFFNNEKQCSQQQRKQFNLNICVIILTHEAVTSRCGGPCDFHNCWFCASVM